MKLDVAPQRKLSRKSPVEKAPSSAPAASNSSGCKKNASRTNVVTQRTNGAKNAGGRSSSTALQSGAVTSAMLRSTTYKKQSRTSPAKSTAKLKGERNFILENKLNVKKISSLNKFQAGASGSNSASQIVCIIYNVII